MYYIIKDPDEMKPNNLAAYSFLPQAIARAKALSKADGGNYRIIKIETVWVSQTIEEALNE